MHVLQGLAQRRQLRVREHRGGQPVLELARGRLVEREAHQLTQPSLGESFGAGIDRRQMLFGAGRRGPIDAPIFGVHDFQALGAAAHFAEAAYAGAARQPFLLLRGEIKESQREETRAVADPREHLAAAAKRRPP